MKAKSHAADAANAEILARAEKFRIHLFLGVGKYARAEAPTLAEAQAAAKRMEAEHPNGRKALIYGVSPEGRQALYVPQSPTQEVPMAKPKKAATKPAKAVKAAKPKAARNPRPRAEASQPRPAARHAGKRAAIEEAAKNGTLPSAPDFSADTHKRFRGKLAEVKALVDAGNIDALKAFEINPISSSPKAIAKYRDLAVIALEANAAKQAEA